MTLVAVDTTNAVAVTDYLTRARDWLSRAVDETGPEQIAAAKAEIATAAEATKQLGLSKEIQLDAQEMVRRAEYALGKAIRKGQAEETINKHGDNQRTSGTSKSSMYDYTTRNEWHSAGGQPGIAQIADLPEVEFEAAIGEARQEGNLSRANVARKAGGAPVTERNFQEAELVTAFRSTIRPLTSPKNVATLSPKARALLIDLLRNAIATLEEGTDQ